MHESELFHPGRGGSLAAGRMPGFGEVQADVALNFSQDGALGMILIDASALAEIEKSFGCEAHRRALGELGSITAELIGDRLGISDMIVLGETGRDEVVVLVFREPNEVDFYRRELPALVRTLAHGYRERGNRIGYPYLRQTPSLPIGTASALRNPTIGTETQLRAALEEARGDANLSERIAARRRRQRLFDLVLEGQVYSVYEPIVDVASHTVYGYEALARGPEGSELHLPAALFASAEEEDLLFQLDCLCRQSALRGARDFPRESKLFVNVRPTTIHDPNFQADALGRTLEESHLQPSDVVFEISEQESISNFAIFREMSDQYRSLGFQFALDDTGSGYAGFEELIELQPEFIKIDRSMVSGVDQDPARIGQIRPERSRAWDGSRTAGCPTW